MSNKQKKAAQHAITFPPFPPAPPGLVSFKDFKERGIKINPANGPDDVERDGLGIPTIALHKKHDTDVCKTNTRRKLGTASVEEMASGAADAKQPGESVPWWEEWAEQDRTRNAMYIDPNMNILDRMAIAMAEFRKRRNGPPLSTNVSYLWDQFKIFAGLMTITPVWNRTDQATAEEEEEDDESDFEEEVPVNMGSNTGHQQSHRRKELKPRPPYDLYDKDPVQVSSDEQVCALLDQEQARKSERALEFLHNIEFYTKVYLSSYMRDQGLLWAEKNLDNMPPLLHLFYNYLLRHRILPAHEKDLRAGLRVVGQARKELPLTAKLARAMPDQFSRACNDRWRSQTQPDPFKDVNNPAQEDKKNADAHPGKSRSSVEEPEAKRARTDKSADEQSFEEELKKSNAEILTSPEVAATAEAKEVESSWGMPAAAAESAGWGASDGPGWGTDLVDVDGDNVWAMEGEDPADAASAWDVPDLSELREVLGDLPETHEPGFVVWSVKRVKEIVQPAESKPPLPAGASDAEIAEEKLDRTYAKLVLAPWIGWEMPGDDKESSAPRLKEGSRRPAQLKHDPMTEDVTVLCEPKVLESLVVGMGMGGSWVQLARKDDFVEGQVKKKGKGKSKASSKRFWYLDELQLTLVGYHSVARA